MRLKRATFTFAGAAGALAVTTLAASPAWACNDRDPALRLEAKCGANGQPNWMVSNPNRWGAVPMTWRDDKGGHSDRKVPVPAGGAVALPTHASKVMVVAYRPDRRELPVWQRHGAFGVKHCTAAPTPPKKPHKPAPSKPGAQKPGVPKPSVKPTKSSAKPQAATPVPTAPTGEARPAQPVKAQPKFTG